MSAGFHAKDQQGLNYWIEVIGGTLGGYTTSMLPDKLEPAVSSWHRGPFHSAATGSLVIAAGDKLADWARICREKADEQQALRQSENSQMGDGAKNPLDEFFSQIVELFLRLVAGFLNGLAAGYVSHLALDAVVGRRSIPLLF